MRMVAIGMLFVFAAAVTAAQPEIDVWKPLRPLLGEWSGTGTGEPGKGAYSRSYRFVLGGRFIEVRNRAFYPKQSGNPVGETHEDIGYISYDTQRKLFVLRQFQIEGFVNQYKLESISDDGKTIVFASESIENLAAGWRARETYRLNTDGFTETFELAGPDRGFEIYSTVDFKRARRQPTGRR